MHPRRRLMSNKVYNGMKQASQIWIPLVAALYFGLGNIWGFPKVEEVIGSITVIDVALGTAVAALAHQYKKLGKGYGGELNVIETEETGIVAMQLDVSQSEEDIADREEVLFKVNRGVSPEVR